MHWKIHPPRPSRFPSGGDFAPLGPRDCPRASPSGNLSGLGVQNPRPREISRASGDVFPNTSLLLAVYGYNISRTLSVCCMILLLRPDNRDVIYNNKQQFMMLMFWGAGRDQKWNKNFYEIYAVCEHHKSNQVFSFCAKIFWATLSFPVPPTLPTAHTPIFLTPNIKTTTICIWCKSILADPSRPCHPKH